MASVEIADGEFVALVDPPLRGMVLAAAGGGYTLPISARSLARGVWIVSGGLDAALSDNAFDLAGGDTATIHVATPATVRSGA